MNASKTWSVPNQTYFEPSGRDLRAEVAEPPDEAVRAVRADDEVGVRKLLHLDAELEDDAQLAAARLQDLEQQLARDGRERVAARAQLAPLVADVDRGPSARRCP